MRIPLLLLLLCVVPVFPAAGVYGPGVSGVSGGPGRTSPETRSNDRLVLSAGAGTRSQERAAATIAAAAEEWEQGNAAAAEIMLHALLDEQPDHDAAIDLLERIAASRHPPRDSVSLDAARAALPSTFTAFESAHFLILSDVEPERVRQHLIRLERTRHQFRRFANRLGIRKRPLRHRLVAVLFSDRDAYRAFATTHDHVGDSWVAGYYAPATDRIVFYDIRSNPGVLEAERRLDELRNDLRRLERDAADDPRVDAIRRHIRDEESRVALFSESTTTATTVHEASHQLAFHTRMQVPWVQYPIWLSEGIATSFETDDINLPFGPDRDYEPRRQRFHELLAAQDLMPLRQLISTIEAGPHATDDLIDRLYHQSYALFSWLYRTRRTQLAAFMRSLRLEPPGPIAPHRAIALFEESFGPVDRLERTWMRVMRADAAQ